MVFCHESVFALPLFVCDVLLVHAIFNYYTYEERYNYCLNINPEHKQQETNMFF